jgi:hypothetical protein
MKSNCKPKERKDTANAAASLVLQIGDRDEWVGIDNFKAARCLCGINIP